MVKEVSERLEFVRLRSAPPPPLELLLPVDRAEVGLDVDEETVDSFPLTGVTPVGGRTLGGTSCTWRLSGWLDLDGGGRTKMNV